MRYDNYLLGSDSGTVFYIDECYVLCLPTR